MKRIVISEDDPASRELLEELLSSYGYEVIATSNGADALEMVHRYRPSLVLLDIDLPVLDGYEVLRQIRKDPECAEIPVYAVTAKAMRTEREEALAAGFDAYLTKPIDSVSLLGNVALGIFDANALWTRQRPEAKS